MSRKSLVSFDKETYLIGTDYPEPIGYQGLAPRPVCLAYLYSSQKALHAHLASDYDHMSELMHTWLKDDNMTMLGQNVPFDMAVAVKHLGVPIDLVFEKYDKGLVKDTQIRETLLALATGEAVKNPAKRYNLAAMVDKYLGKDISESKGADAWRLRYSELDGVPLQDWPVEASEYPKDDVRHTLKVFAHQHKHKLFFQTNEKAQTAAAWDLHLISMNSPRVDPPMIDVFESNHDVQAAEAKAPLIEKGIMKPNPNRYKDFPKGDPRRAGHSMNKKLLQKVVQADYTRQGRVVPATEKGDISLAGDTLKGCRSKELREYGEAAGDIKMMDAFVPMLRRAAASHERRVTPRYGVILKTGRTSASSPNLQQQPKASGARECFIPEEGHVFVSIDFSSMEMYCLAQSAKMLYGTTKLLEVLNSGKDPHLMAVEGISGMGYAEMDAKKQAGDKMVGKYRALAKIMNFGFGGGMGGKTATSNLAEYERDTIRDLFPGEKIVSVMDRLSKQWKYTWELMPMFEKAGRLCRGGTVLPTLARSQVGSRPSTPTASTVTCTSSPSERML